ncbi:MAG TPA: PPOX class F420-dependent oxidoreductase [Dehalococcoidia bacterium]|jgi:PPOX class probable F420-dependent enzyme|nr:PPOX class F420-dependent oxidoreductase [Dehalococcoidia bacterium]
MLPDSVREFASRTHRGVLTTFRRNGGAQMSIVSCGPYRNGVAFTTTANRAKLLNLKRNPRCSLLISQEEWRPYVVLEGRAEILSADNTRAEEFRMALRDAYRAASGIEHPNWEEYDRAMIEDRRSVVIVVPERIYGTRV